MSHNEFGGEAQRRREEQQQRQDEYVESQKEEIRHQQAEQRAAEQRAAERKWLEQQRDGGHGSTPPGPPGPPGSQGGGPRPLRHGWPPPQEGGHGPAPAHHPPPAHPPLPGHHPPPTHHPPPEHPGPPLPHDPSVRPGAFRRGCLLGAGCLVVLLGFLALWLIGPSLFFGSGGANTTGAVTTAICDKREDGADLVLTTGAGEFVLGDTPKKTAREQFDELEVGGVHEIVYRIEPGSDAPPVTTGVLDAAADAITTGSCT
ncbi:MULTISPECIES: hypothetical protein [unclassified Nocardiopsis]|uniref:hypothetical protein n=1 Tax=Nocardiopsis TaxID=2013 RepID=UPI00387B893D